MNTTQASITDVLRNVKGDPVTVILIGFVALILVYTTLLSFYLRINKVNRERDKKTLFFPITNHFCFMVKASYFLFVILLIDSTLLMKFPQAVIQFDVSLQILMLFLFYVLNICMQAFHLLIFFLSIGRFTLYFWPSSEKCLIWVQKRLRIRYVYFATIAKEIISFLIVDYDNNDDIDKASSRVDLGFGITCLVLSVFIFVSAILYIPIMFSVRKQSNLRTFKKDRPQTYIFWQTMVVLIFKSTYIPFFIASTRGGEFSMSTFIHFILLSDFVTMPLIIQVSYLACNKRNSNMLCSSLRFQQFMRNSVYVSSSVRPANAVEIISSQVSQA